MYKIIFILLLSPAVYAHSEVANSGSYKHSKGSSAKSVAKPINLSEEAKSSALACFKEVCKEEDEGTQKSLLSAAELSQKVKDKLNQNTKESLDKIYGLLKDSLVGHHLNSKETNHLKELATLFENKKEDILADAQSICLAKFSHQVYNSPTKKTSKEI